MTFSTYTQAANSIRRKVSNQGTSGGKGQTHPGGIGSHRNPMAGNEVWLGHSELKSESQEQAIRFSSLLLDKTASLSHLFLQSSGRECLM